MKQSVKTSIEIRKSCTRTIRKMEALGYLFNRRTGRPTVYIQPDGSSSVGYAYVRCVEENHGTAYYTLGAICNSGGGVIAFHGFISLMPAEMLQKLRKLVNDPAWLERFKMR